jgi:hypothetical protein
MKAIKMRIQKSSHLGIVLLATVVGIITSMVVANATQTITTPNAAFISYALMPGANSAAITPVTNRSVLVMGLCLSTGGVGQASLYHIPSSGGNGGIGWVALDANGGITSGFDATTGTHIVYIGDTVVDIQVAGADTIRVHNASGGQTVAGNVTLIW